MKFIDQHFTKIIIIILVIAFIQTCTISRKSSTIEKQSKITNARLDSIQAILFTKNDIAKLIEIEGLKSEKRMIQSTDRKIFDVNRQAEIDKEIKKIESNK
jgi:hypothetical protein